MVSFVQSIFAAVSELFASPAIDFRTAQAALKVNTLSVALFVVVALVVISNTRRHA